MKTKITKCLVLGALAISITSTAMAGDHGKKTEKLCNLSTLKGLYHFSHSEPTRTTTGEFRLDGQGGGVGHHTIKFSEAANRSDQDVTGVFRYEQNKRGECVFSIVESNGKHDNQSIYAEVSGDAASWETSSNALSTALTRDPITTTNE
jgi:hypothetical protein